MSDDNEYEDEDKGIKLPPDSLRLSISVVVPSDYLKNMNYDSFVAYSDVVIEETTKRIKDAMIDEWFKKQPLYNGE